MDTYSSGEDLFIKTRKPYTITKQRERWTEEEHNKFLEALKLYGRAWQRIEEHIGTKTAVQIRSHAQKFFTKLEKEAIAKGVPIGQALDIDIPPPRPKRKPSNPYPRKTGVSSSTSQVGAKDGKGSTSLSVPHNQQVLDLEKEPPPEKPSIDEKSTGAKGNHDDSCSEVYTSSSSVYSLKKNPTPQQEGSANPCSFREFVPCLKDVVSQDAPNESHVTTGFDGNKTWYKAELRSTVHDNVVSNTLQLENSCHLHDNLQQRKKADDPANILPGDKMQSMQKFPEHIPVQILDGKTCTQTPPSDAPCHKSMVPGRESRAQSTVYSLLTTTAAEIHNNVLPSSHQSFPPCPHSFAPVIRSQDDYRSFLQMSSTFPSLIVSTLQQNSAAHAAASFAASFWPFANVGNAAGSPACTKEGFSSREVNSAPSMAAIAAATVAAATAWWAASGLLPMCTPLQTAFACPPVTTAPPSVHSSEGRDAKMASKEVNLENPPLDDEQMEPEHLEAAQAHNSSSKSPDNYSSECEENGGLKPNATPTVADQETIATPPEVLDSNKSKNMKQVDRSSCGSNTASSSEVETDALEKNEKDKEEIKETETNPPAQSDSRRTRSNGSTSDSWKSVSEEGRLAFRALFSREVLPQSFSPPPKGESEDNDEVEMPYVDRRNGDSEVFDLNSKAGSQEGEEKNPSIPLCLAAIGVGNNGKLKGRRTGFKPYKRCAVEAKENRSCSCRGEEKESKRICLGLEAEAST